MEMTTQEVIDRNAAAKKAAQSDDPVFWEEVNKELKTPPNIFFTLTANELIEKEFPPIKWLVKGLIPSEGFTAITGTPASYKSFLTEHLAVCLTQNQPFLGNFEVTPCPVLILDKENPLSLLQERFKKLGLTNQAELYFLEHPDYFKLQDKTHLDWLINFIKEKNIKLLILDSFVHIHKGDENDSQAIAATFERLKLIPCAIVFIHHHRKTIKFFTGTPLESIRGSSDIAAEVESHLAVDIVQTGLRIAQYKNRRGELIQPFLVTPLITEEAVVFSYGGQIDEEITKVQKAKQAIIDTFQKPFTRQEALQALDELGRNSIDQGLKQLVSEGFYTAEIIGKNKMYKPSLASSLLGNDEISLSEQSYLEEAEKPSP